MDELARPRGQVAAALEQLTPEASGRGLERQWTKRVADLSHEHQQMRLKSPPVTADEFAPTRYLGRSLAVKPLRNGRGVDRPIRLRELRQATDADVTVPAPEAPDPNPQHQCGRAGDITMVIAECFQAMRAQTIGTSFRRTDLPLIVLLGILFGGQ